MDNLNETSGMSSVQRRRRAMVRGLGRFIAYVAIGGIILVTAIHAVMLVMATTSEIVEVGGVMGILLNVVRLTFPILAEIAAIAALINHFTGQWRGYQVYAAFAVEVLWLVFAAINLTTVFALERGTALDPFHVGWISWGFPVSSLLICVAIYVALRLDPEALFADERQTKLVEIAKTRFEAEMGVFEAAEYREVVARRQWLQVAADLRRQGFTEAEIAHLLSGAPTLNTPALPAGQQDLPIEVGASEERARQVAGSFRNGVGPAA